MSENERAAALPRLGHAQIDELVDARSEVTLVVVRADASDDVIELQEAIYGADGKLIGFADWDSTSFAYNKAAEPDSESILVSLCQALGALTKPILDGVTGEELAPAPYTENSLRNAMFEDIGIGNVSYLNPSTESLEEGHTK